MDVEVGVANGARLPPHAHCRTTTRSTPRLRVCHVSHAQRRGEGRHLKAVVSCGEGRSVNRRCCWGWLTTDDVQHSLLRWWRPRSACHAHQRAGRGRGAVNTDAAAAAAAAVTTGPTAQQDLAAARAGAACHGRYPGMRVGRALEEEGRAGTGRGGWRGARGDGCCPTPGHVARTRARRAVAAALLLLWWWWWWWWWSARRACVRRHIPHGPGDSTRQQPRTPSDSWGMG